MKKISVIIPSFNAVALLQKNLPKVLAAMSAGDELVIVDDNGTDETLNWLVDEFKLESVILQPSTVSKQYYPNPNLVAYDAFQAQLEHHTKRVVITALRLKQNLRFAGAANLGVLLAQNELVFLCNNDVVPEKDCLDYLRPHFDDEAVFAVGCLEFEDTQKGQKSGKNILYFEQGLFQHNRAKNFTSGETAWASGGSALYDRAKWLALEGFDQAFYPAYWEDIDLSFRARQNGWQVLFEENAVVYHKHESTHRDVFGEQKMQRISWRNSFIFTWKNATVAQRFLFILWLPYWLYKSKQ